MIKDISILSLNAPLLLGGSSLSSHLPLVQHLSHGRVQLTFELEFQRTR